MSKLLQINMLLAETLSKEISEGGEDNVEFLIGMKLCISEVLVSSSLGTKMTKLYDCIFMLADYLEEAVKAEVEVDWLLQINKTLNEAIVQLFQELEGSSESELFLQFPFMKSLVQVNCLLSQELARTINIVETETTRKLSAITTLVSQSLGILCDNTRFEKLLQANMIISKELTNSQTGQNMDQLLRINFKLSEGLDQLSQTLKLPENDPRQIRVLQKFCSLNRLLSDAMLQASGEQELTVTGLIKTHLLLSQAMASSLITNQTFKTLFHMNALLSEAMLTLPREKIGHLMQTYSAVLKIIVALKGKMMQGISFTGDPTKSKGERPIIEVEQAKVQDAQISRNEKLENAPDITIEDVTDVNVEEEPKTNNLEDKNEDQEAKSSELDVQKESQEENQPLKSSSGITVLKKPSKVKDKPEFIQGGENATVVEEDKKTTAKKNVATAASMVDVYLPPVNMGRFARKNRSSNK